PAGRCRRVARARSAAGGAGTGSGTFARRHPDDIGFWHASYAGSTRERTPEGSARETHMAKETDTAERTPTQRGWLDRYFEISARGSTIGREIRGGVVTFFAMAYIIALNP